MSGVKSLSELIHIIGWDALYLMYKNIPEGATHYCERNMHFIKGISKPFFDEFRYEMWGELLGTWLPMESDDPNFLSNYYDIFRVKQYVEAWSLVVMHGGLIEAEDCVNRAIIYDSAFYKLKDAVELFKLIDYPYHCYEDDIEDLILD